MQVSVSLDPYIVGIGDPIHGHVDIKLHEKSNLAKYPQMQTILTPEKQTVPCFASVTISIVGKCFLEKNYFAEPNTGGLEVENVSGKVFAVNFVACKASTLPLPLVLLSKHSDRPERKLNSFKIQFEAQMDQEILPSYVGSAVKIVYFVVVLVLDSAGKSVKEINVPFTVIPKDSAVDVFNFPKDPVFVELEARLVEAVAEDSRFEGNRIELVDENVESVVNVPVVPYNSDDEDEDLGVSDEEKEDSVHSEVNLPQNEPNAMLISSKGSLVAKLLLPKTKLSCGDIVRGIVDFSESKICGYRLTVTLERKEDLPQITNSSLRAGKDHIKILAYSHHYTYHCEDISFTFSLPDPRFSPSSLACPNIKSDIFSSDWFLRLKFVVDKVENDEISSNTADEDHSERSLDSIELQNRSSTIIHPEVRNDKVEVLECTVPLDVSFSTLDLKTSHPSQLIKSRLYHIYD